MAIQYTRSGTAVSGRRQAWGDFYTCLKVCSNCGRSSFLNDVCPDCGKKMKKAAKNQLWRYIAWSLLCIPLPVAAQWALVCLVRWEPLWARILVLSVSGLIHGLGCLAYIRCFVLAFKGERPFFLPREVYRFNKSQQRAEGELSEHCYVLEAARDAYCLDVAWLGSRTRQLTPGDTLTRDRLLGQAVWLSVICDTPQLAQIRLDLLRAAPISDGTYTDISGIMEQILYSDRVIAARMGQDASVAEIVSECVMFDAEGLSPEKRKKVCAGLQTLLKNPKKYGLTRYQVQLFWQALRYCGAEQTQGGAV